MSDVEKIAESVLAPLLKTSKPYLWLSWKSLVHS
jgi:hypothetical protein